MTVSAFELFRVGIGPSSSHTVGPMRAAAEFVSRIDPYAVSSVDIELFGSLAATGRGHGTLTAVLLGLEGLRPETILPEQVEDRRESIRRARRVHLASVIEIPLCEDDIVLAPWDHLPGHSNALRLSARGADGDVLASEVYYSIGGGFIQREGDAPSVNSAVAVPHPFGSAAELLGHCESEQCSIAEIVMRNETVSRGQYEVRRRLLEIWDIMQQCVRASVARSGTLPGPLRVPRRAPDWHRRVAQLDPAGEDPAHWLERLNMVALAVNEENATGGRVVTAPTNGAAGIIPAVLDFALRYSRSQDLPQDDATVRFLLTATAIGSIVKERASLSGAEVGCQGEVGSASSMAAAGLAAVLGGSPRQVENAAEIAMEHNLGLTCDPVGGLVQIPCIERNAIAATKAVNAAKMALWGDGSHIVSLDAVIETMRQTGLDMSTSYKETSTGGLAVNVVEC